MLLNKLKR